MPTKEQRYDEAIELQQSGRLKEAVGKLEALVEQEADYALAHSALSVFYGKLEQPDKAVEHARKACELEPDDPFCFCRLKSDLPEGRPDRRGGTGPHESAASRIQPRGNLARSGCDG